jgi:hypothetical protein
MVGASSLSPLHEQRAQIRVCAQNGDSVSPLAVTNLAPRNEQRTTPTKLNIEAMEELVAVAEGSEGACSSSLGRSGTVCRGAA